MANEGHKKKSLRECDVMEKHKGTHDKKGKGGKKEKSRGKKKKMFYKNRLEIEKTICN